MEKKIAISIDDLTVAYGYKPVLWDIDLKIPEGVLMAIIGPNGAGKSTLLKSILNIIKPLAGSIKIYDKPYEKQKNLIAYIPQKGSVDWDFPTTALDVVKMGTYGNLGWIKRPGKSETNEALKALETVGMTAFKHRQISQLSGGQQQRIFLARALVQKASIYFMDEPFQGIDAITEKSIIEILKELKKSNKTVVVVHHDLQTILDYFDWVTFLNVKKIATGPVAKIFNDDNLTKTYGTSYKTSIIE